MKTILLSMMLLFSIGTVSNAIAAKRNGFCMATTKSGYPCKNRIYSQCYGPYCYAHCR